MPKRFQNVSQDFRAGVLSPRYTANVTSEAFAHSLRVGKNAIVSSQGGVAYREGMEFIEYNATQQPSRLFQFRRGGDVSDLLLEVNAGQTRYWLEDENGQIGLLVDNVTILFDEDSPDPNDPDLLTDENGNFLTLGTVITSNPYELSDLESLYFTNQAEYAILCHTSHPPYYITLSGDASLSSLPIPVERIPEFIYNDYKSPQLVSQAAQWKVSFPSGWNVNGFIYYVTYNGVQGTNSLTFDSTNAAANASAMETELTNAAAAQGYTTAFSVTAIDVLNYTVAVSGDDSGYSVQVTPIYGNVYLPIALPPLSQPIEGAGSDPVAEPAWSYPWVILSDGFYFKCIQVHRSTPDDRPGNPMAVNAALYWENLGAVKPEGYDYQNPDGLGWGAGNIYSPYDRGFPTVAVFHEQRLVLCANKDNPTAIYGSAIGLYQNYNSGPNDDEPWLYILDSSDTPQIKWARSQKALILGTSSGEWVIDSSPDSTITSSDISAQMQNSTRAKLLMAIQVDTEVFYIEQGQRKLRATRYNRDYGTFYSSYASIMAEHLVATDGINRLVHAETPETLLTMVTTKGQPVWMTYERDVGLMAFTEGETDGQVYDVATYFSIVDNRDYSYYIVNRNNRYTLERMRYPESKATENFTQNDIVFLDSWVTGTVSGTTITGLEHLEQKDVYVLLDDAWQVDNPFTVLNGQITLPADETGKLYAVGLPYQGLIENFEMSDNVQGTGLGTKRRWNQLYTRVLNSSRPLINGQRAEDRRPGVPLGTSDNVIAGIYDFAQTNQGYESKGVVTVEQDRPYPLYVVGFFGQYQVEDN